MSRQTSRQARRAVALLMFLTGLSSPTVSSDLTAQKHLEVDLFYGNLATPLRNMAEGNRQAALEKVRSNQPLAWRSSDGRASGFVTPLRSFKIKAGYFCREFIEAISLGTEVRSTTAIACRADDGAWKVVRYN